MPDRLLITGASGLLGSNLSLRASTRFEVVACHHRSELHFPGVNSLRLDITDATAMSDAVAFLKPTVVVHCAAETRVDWCEDHPDVVAAVNIGGTINVCQATAREGAVFVYISTDSVFDGARGNYREEDKPGPLNVYARSKWLGEEAVRREALDHLIVRTNFYGWNAEAKESMAEWMLLQLRAGRRLPGFHDVVFSPLLVDDLVEKLLSLLEHRARGTFHLGSADTVSKFTFARRLAQTFSLDPTLVEAVSVDSLQQLRARRPKVTSLDSTKAQQFLGSAMPTVEDGLRRFQELEDTGEVSIRREALRSGLRPVERSEVGRP